MNSSFDFKSAATTRSSERLPWIGADFNSVARRPTNPVCLPVAPTTVRKLIIFRAAEFRVQQMISTVLL